MKTFLTCCLAALLGFGLLAARPAQAKQHLLLGSSIVGGSYYVLGGTYAKYINDTYPDLDVSVEVGGGPYSNITLLSNGEIDLGFATTWATGEMYDGINDQKKKHEDIRAFLPLFPSYLQIYSLAESPIKNMEDIQGKIASSGAAGSSGRIATQTLFDILGIKPAKLNSVPTGTQINNIFEYSLKEARGFSQQVVLRGKKPDTLWVNKRVVKCPEEVAQQLAVEAGSDVFLLKRIRYVDEEAVSIEDSWVPAHLIHDVDAIGISLYD